MFYSKKTFQRSNDIHKSLSIMHHDYISNFNTHLVNSKEKEISKKCPELLMIDVYKYLNGTSLQMMNDIFKFRKISYNLKNFHLLESQNPTAKRYGPVRFGKLFPLKLGT